MVQVELQRAGTTPGPVFLDLVCGAASTRANNNWLVHEAAQVCPRPSVPDSSSSSARGSVLYEDCGSKQQQPLFFFFFSLASIHLVLDQPAQLSPPSLTSPLTRSVRPDLVLAWTRFPWNPIRRVLVFVFLLLSNIRLLNLTSTNPPTKMLF